MSKRIFSVFVALFSVFTVGASAGLIDSSRREIRVIVKAQGVDPSMIEKSSGKVYLFEAKSPNGMNEWPINMSGVVMTALIDVPKDLDSDPDPTNIEAAFMIQVKQGNRFKCTAERNVLFNPELNRLTLEAVCESSK